MTRSRYGITGAGTLAAAVALCIALPSPVLAQQSQSSQPQASRAAADQSQQHIHQVLQKLQQARRNIEQSAGSGGGDIGQARQNAQEALQEIDQSLSQLDKQASRNTKQALQSLRTDLHTAQDDLKKAQENPEQAAQALQKVENSLQQVRQQMAGTAGGGQAEPNVGMSESRQATERTSDKMVESFQQTGEAMPFGAAGEGLIGKELVGANGESFGEVENVLMAGSKLQSVIVDIGGFLGLGEKTVAIPVEKLGRSIQGDKVTINMTREEVERLPEYERGNGSATARATGQLLMQADAKQAPASCG